MYILYSMAQQATTFQNWLSSLSWLGKLYGFLIKCRFNIPNKLVSHEWEFLIPSLFKLLPVSPSICQPHSLQQFYHLWHAWTILRVGLSAKQCNLKNRLNFLWIITLQISIHNVLQPFFSQQLFHLYIQTSSI